MQIKRLAGLALLAASAATLGGCATTTSISPDAEVHYDANYDFSDKKLIADTLTASLLNTVDLSGTGKKPVMVVYPVANETSEHISTSGITDDIQLALLRAGKYRFVSKTQRDNLMAEQQHQQSNGDPSSRSAVGRQLGADFILSGTLRSIEKKQQKQIRLTKKKMVYYSLNLELTDLSSGEIAWADKADLARESSKPIIGW
mgnify:CR=1 FL=1